MINIPAIPIVAIITVLLTLGTRAGTCPSPSSAHS